MAFTVRSILPSHPFKLDFNGDARTDFLWRGADGTIAAWNMSADGLSGRSGLFLPNPDPRGNTLTPWLGDWNGDGTTDVLFQNRAGAMQTWSVHNNLVTDIHPLTNYGVNNYQIRATGDFNGDGKTDLLWFVPPAPVAGAADGVWVTASAEDRPIPPLGLGRIAPFSIDFQLVGVGDFDGDGRDGILFRGTGNATVGTFLIQEPVTVAPRDSQMPTRPITFADPGTSWAVLGLDDFNGDGKTDILWEHTNAAGKIDGRSIWLMNGNAVVGGGMVGYPGSEWSMVGTGDYDNDGKADLMWRHAPTGTITEWLMDGANVKGFGAAFANPGDFWMINGL